MAGSSGPARSVLSTPGYIPQAAMDNSEPAAYHHGHLFGQLDVPPLQLFVVLSPHARMNIKPINAYAFGIIFGIRIMQNLPNGISFFVC
jgi:hypothetical protein